MSEYTEKNERISMVDDLKVGVWKGVERVKKLLFCFVFIWKAAGCVRVVHLAIRALHDKPERTQKQKK